MHDQHLLDIAATYGTPCYVYDTAIVERQIHNLRQYFSNAHIYYALKANPYHGILELFQQHNFGAEVISQGEIKAAREAALPLLVGGPRQDEAMLACALEHDDIGYISLDSASQWQNWQEVHHAQQQSQEVMPKGNLLIRLNPQLDPKTHPHLATGAADSKFGLPLEQVHTLATRLGAHLCGFHVHAGSQISDISIYDAILTQMEQLFRTFPQAKSLNLGGGFAVPTFDMAAFAAKIQPFVAEHGLELILEPGRFLVAEAGVLLTRVLHHKKGQRNHVICDASMATLLRPALYNAEHPIRKLGAQEGVPEVVDIQGCLCENSDILGRARRLPPICKGDILVIEQAGAYGSSMASAYAGSSPANEVMIDSRQLP